MDEAQLGTEGDCWFAADIWSLEKMRSLRPSLNSAIRMKPAIPALGDRSVLETLKSSNGEEVLRNYFAKVIGRF